MNAYYIVDSLEGIDPAEFIGAYFETPDGVYQAIYADELGGIGSIFSKVLGVAAPFLSFIPGVGSVAAMGAGLASSALGAKAAGDAAKQAANEGAITQIRGEIEKIVAAYSAGAIGTEREAHAALDAIYKSWDAWKMSQDSKSKNYLYNTGDLQILKWSEATAAIVEIGKQKAAEAAAAQAAAAAAQAQSVTGIIGGALSPDADGKILGVPPLYLGIGAGVFGLIFLFRR